MTVADLGAVCAMERMCFTTPWSKALFEEELRNPQTCFWRVLEAAPKGVIAYGGFWRAVDEAHFTNIAVHPQQRGLGFGRRLLQALLDEAKAQGCLRATLEVRPSNQEALGLYQSIGFEVAALRPRYYSDNNEDAMILWKNSL